MDNRNEDAMMRALRAIIHTEITKRIDEELSPYKFDIEDYRNDIETMISEYVNGNLTVNIEC